MTRRVVEKLCTKKVCVDFLAPRITIPFQNHYTDKLDYFRIVKGITVAA